jgi:hypothetical protein
MPVATRRFSRQGSVCSGVPCVLCGIWGELRFIVTWFAGALNWATGETVAVKEIQLSNIPKGELGEIMVRVLAIYSRLSSQNRWFA